MSKPLPDKAQLKKVVREVLLELLAEDNDLLRAIFAEVLEDLMLGELVEQGRKSPLVPRREIIKILKKRVEQN
jgi:hypothetical protein